MKQAHLPLVLLASILPAALGLLSPRATLQSVALDIPVPLAADEAQQGPQVPVTRFTRRVWGGSGCPPRQSPDEDRTQAFRVATDGVLAYDFTDLYAYTGPAWNGGQPFMDADCMVLVSITDIPPGWNFRVTSMRVRGYSSLMLETSARISATLSFGDEVGFLVSSSGPSSCCSLTPPFHPRLLFPAWDGRHHQRPDGIACRANGWRPTGC